MKKKRNFLVIISSLFGVVAVCGLFACSSSRLGKKIQTNASANLSSLANANMYIGSNELTNYPLYDITSDVLYYIVGGVSQSSWAINFRSNYIFQAGNVYKFYIDLRTTNLSNINGFNIDSTLASNSVNLDGSTGSSFLAESSTIYSKTFKMNSTYSTSNIAWITVTGSVSLGNVGFNLYRGTYFQDTYFVYNSLVEQLYTVLGYDVFKFDVDYYYNGVIYNGLKVYISPNGSYNQLYITTLDFTNALNNTGFAFVLANKYNSTSDLQFVNGVDITNSTLLYVMNLIYTLRGFNTFDGSYISVGQYNQIIADLNGQIDELRDSLDDLTQSYNYLNTQYQVSYNTGFSDGVSSVESQLQTYYNNGKADGFNEGLAASPTAMTIISGIFQVALVPVNFFLGIFNFKVLGINFTSLIQAIFTIALTIIIVKVVLGKKGE